MDDPLTQACSLVLAYLKAESTLAAFNWQIWDSDADVEQPRGYVNASSEAALLYGKGPVMLRMEVILENKPKQQGQADIMAAVVAKVNDPGMSNALNALV